MTEAMQGLLADAKKGRYSSIRDSLSEDDVASVWENVSTFLDKQMSQQKGVQIPVLGTFTFSQKKLDIGNNKFVLIQRPVFNISEKFAQTHGLQFTKYHVPGQIPVVPLNFAALSFESPFDRDTVESCVREILNAVSRAVGARRNVELTFTGIGRLSIRENRVKMKFFKEFVRHMDGSGKLVDALQNRPGTVDSVISERCFSRPPTSNTLVLPNGAGNHRITASNSNALIAGCLEPVAETEEGGADTLGDGPGLIGDPLDQAPDPFSAVEGGDIPADVLAAAVAEDQAMEIQAAENQALFHPVAMEEPTVGDIHTAAAIDNILNEGDEQPAVNTMTLAELGPETSDAPQKPIGPVRSMSRMTMPLPKASGVCLLDDLQIGSARPSQPPTPPNLTKFSPAPLQDVFSPQPPVMDKPMSAGHLAPLERGVTFDQTAMDRARQHSASCGHPHAGQELCYLCHQRARRNVPVSFVEERRRREVEEDRLLQQYQAMKDAEQTITEHENNLSKRQDLQKMAAFNLGVADATIQKKKARDTDFQRSYIFQRRPLTPPRFPKQQGYFKDLASQVDMKEQTKQKRNADEAFFERLEQVQLAEDLAAQREQYLKDKYDQTDVYKKALESQIHLRDRFRKPDGLLRSPEYPTSRCPLFTPDLTYSHLTVPRPYVLRPFAEKNTAIDCASPFTLPRLRFKPVPMPSCEPDSEVFGKNDMNNEKMAERRQRAHNLFREQQDFVSQKKRDIILKRLREQKEEEETLSRTRKELLDDRANRHHMRFLSRRRLEDDWSKSADMKRGRELEDRLRSLSPGILVHEQCDKYHRCRQCLRQLRNCGESNIWSESRYIPGSRLMV
ncbi:LOW QUALITY PROTEIN: coiled-coil domain-containing protein 81-like [Haliotis rubra]|uniref:LOW QUALITY PROTEIN: coiled-coil domain-containing protein 81-like n=1 Tax=Haliotis rubra TaxID=36100 RepID=UPI001EE5CE99|nr:LOW QUALITY PROTEIN: coiled-coil domain-containing protein 81-like [Haliotis rubra]